MLELPVVRASRVRRNRSVKASLVLTLTAATLGAVACQSSSGAASSGADVVHAQAQQLPPLSPGDAETLYFEPGSSVLSAPQLATLASFAARLAPNREIRLHVQGYSGAGAEETADRWLSEQRAKNVASYLSSQGVAVENLTLQGNGEMSDPTGDARRAVITVR